MSRLNLRMVSAAANSADVYLPLPISRLMCCATLRYLSLFIVFDPTRCIKSVTQHWDWWQADSPRKCTYKWIKQQVSDTSVRRQQEPSEALVQCEQLSEEGDGGCSRLMSRLEWRRHHPARTDRKELDGPAETSKAHLRPPPPDRKGLVLGPRRHTQQTHSIGCTI